MCGNQGPARSLTHSLTPSMPSTTQTFTSVIVWTRGQAGRGAQAEKGKSEGKAGKGKAKAKDEPAVGGLGKGKGQSLKHRLPFASSALQVDANGTWRYRQGVCTSLPHLFATLGNQFTAAEIYKYYNLCTLFATKKPRAWSSPYRQQARQERYKATGRYGFGRLGR